MGKLKVRVKLYSLLKDLVGLSEILVEIEEGSTVKDLIERLKTVEGFSKAMTLARSIVVLDEDGRRLHEGDRVPGGTVHVMPPPAGGAYIEVGVASDELDMGDIERRLAKASRGAVSIFVGYVKPENGGERVEALIYEHSQELLQKVLERIAREEAERWGLSGVAIYHYVGRREVGERTIVVGVAAGSRKEVLPALAEIVERVKREAPIWKVELRESGKYYILGDSHVKA